ncbi:MAG TPA: dihydrolipoamide acetyltransferase family protein [Steroidobacteraceae bacterium]|nr:dihydrolipoamide acetyltransferase family protein [Steroidobacteraceae bacterium]
MSTFRLPDLGEGLAEAEILAWHVKVGDQVRIDQPMVSVETAKAVVEVPAPFSGTVIALRGAPGDIVATGAPLVDFDSGTVVGSMPAASEEEFVESAGRTPGNGHGTAERTTNGSDAARARAIPAARALARHLNVDLAAVDASGRDGSVSIDDVLRHADISPTRGRGGVDGAPTSLAPDSPVAASRAADSLAATASAAASPAARAIAAARPEDGTVEPLRGMRRAMAQSMSLSRDQVAGSTVCDDADLHHWTHRGDYMLRLVRAMVCAWRSEPALNAWYDAAGHSRMLVSHMDLAIAVDTPDGLIVPVVRDVEKKSPRELREAIAEQKEAAHRRATPAQDLRGFTLMLSNFGTLAGRYGIPRVVPPAVAILGAGKVREDAVAAAGKVEAHLRMPLSLSFDHRCITGGEACRYLGAVIADLEKPD